MSLQRLQFSIDLSRPANQVFQWHERPGALERLSPPWAKIEVVSPSVGVTNGQRVKLRQKLGPVWLNWEVEHHGYVAEKEFSDRALSSPFTSWEHRHRVVANGAGRSTLIDELSYQLPGGTLGQTLAGGFARRELERLFAFRHSRFASDLAAAAQYGAVRPMRVLISGASGLIGSALIPFLRTQGHEVIRLVRHKPMHDQEVFWDPMRGELDEHQLKSIDAVIHLAGANVATRWTKAARDQIWNSRVIGTRTLVDAISRMKHRPFVFVSASGVGIYGSRDGEVLTESSSRGKGFLADVCEAWEQQVLAVEELGVRPVMLRTGMVLSPAGGALAKLLPVFRAGLGGQIGSGHQWVSWISIDDIVGAYYHALLDQRCVHAINAVAPEPVTNQQFTQILARVLSRPAVVAVPTPALRLAYGQMAEEVLLATAKVQPDRLTETGYRFRQPELEQALRFVLGRAPASRE